MNGEYCGQLGENRRRVGVTHVCIELTRVRSQIQAKHAAKKSLSSVAHKAGAHKDSDLDVKKSDAAKDEATKKVRLRDVTHRTCGAAYTHVFMYV